MAMSAPRQYPGQRIARRRRFWWFALCWGTVTTIELCVHCKPYLSITFRLVKCTLYTRQYCGMIGMSSFLALKECERNTNMGKMLNFLF